MSVIIGRKKEIEELEKLYHSDRSEFVAVYGRRRVGKTFLINQVFKNRFTFQHTGVSPVDQESEKNLLRTQLESFYYTLLSHGLEGYDKPKTWMEAFFQLKQLLIRFDDGSKQVIFLDELPWMDTPRSGFLPAFESFWNGWCSGRDNIMLIVCGSATSWILGNLSRNKGGLYGRLTDEIKLSPFTLKECEEYFEHENIIMSRYDIIQAYMVFGGIPYYLRYFKKGFSLSANIDEILFGRNPRLKDEYNRLFKAIFSNPEDCKKIIKLLSTKHIGYTREEISAETGIPFGGGLTNTLTSLIESDFIQKYTPYNEHGKVVKYKLIDNFCLFWLKHVEANSNKTNYMTENITSDILKYWRGIAFEEVCWQHIDNIKNALGIKGLNCSISAWSIKGNDNREGAQIDLLIIRKDNIVNLCEMKFASDIYNIDKEEDSKLRHRIETLKDTLSAKQAIHLTIISTYGIKYGKYSGLVQKEITMDDLFGLS